MSCCCSGPCAGLTGATWRSASVAALFAVHPLHVEVGWRGVAERKDVLSTLFGLLALVSYATYARRPNWGGYLVVFGLFCLSLLAKPMLVTLPCVFLLLDWWPLRRWQPGGRSATGPGTPPSPVSLWRLLAEKLPLVAVALASSAVTLVAQRSARSVASLEGLPLGRRLANALAAYGGIPGPDVLASPPVAPSTPCVSPLYLGTGPRRRRLLAAVSVLALSQARPAALTWPWAGFWFLGTLVPVIGLVQVGPQALADRYTYVPHVGLFVALVWGRARPAGVPAEGPGRPWQGRSPCWSSSAPALP